MSSVEDDEIIQEFLVESHENLNDLDNALVALEKDPSSRELLASVFRTIHTIKGTSGFLAFSKLESVTHVGENVLARLRDGQMELDARTADALLRMVDTVRDLLSAIEETGQESQLDVSPVVDELTRCLAPDKTVAEPPAATPAEGCPPSTAGEVAAPVVTPEAGHIPATVSPLAAAGESPADRAPLTDESRATPEEDDVQDQDAPPTPPFPTTHEAVPPDPAEPHDAHVPEPIPEDDTTHRRNLSDSTIRVDVDLLDQLMRMVGELVLTRNQILQQASESDDGQAQRSAQRLNLIASELQEGVMKTRMQPIEHLWSRMPRVVRDLASQCGKQVNLVLEGGETELDRSLLEAVKDPITHLVRNAIDHGIEYPKDRVAAGKSEAGTLTLRAFHEGGQVVIEVADDGAGINAAAVAAKAVDRGLLTREQVAVLSDRELVDLIFLPGFSTAAQVTNVSGRGVGMDVVRTHIERAGGMVDVVSTPGEGSTIRVRIPLTLAIIPALIVRQASSVYAIPQVNLVELVRASGDDSTNRIEHVAGAPVFRLRGNLLPLVSLGEVLNSDSSAWQDDSLNIVVVATDQAHFGLVVDDIHDTQEIVVRPLARQIKSVPTYAGATITGAGKVALILDIAGLATSAVQSRSMAARRDDAEEKVVAGGTTKLLVCRVGRDRQVAVAMGSIARLEEVPRTSVENAAGLDVVQYRGGLLPLVHVGPILGEYDTPDGDDYPVIVHHSDAGPVGLVVAEILDVVDEEVQVTQVRPAVGLSGTVVVSGRVTDLLDVDAVALQGGHHG